MWSWVTSTQLPLLQPISKRSLSFNLLLDLPKLYIHSLFLWPNNTIWPVQITKILVTQYPKVFPGPAIFLSIFFSNSCNLFLPSTWQTLQHPQKKKTEKLLFYISWSSAFWKADKINSFILLVKGGAEPTDAFQMVIDNGIVTGKTKRNRR
jgi:hypothetical protein